MKEIYIVLSQTGTVLSRILKLITKDPYNHASVTPYEDLHKMYSFGRRHPYNPFWGGYVVESKDFGTFKRFSETQVQVLALPVKEALYQDLVEVLDKMAEERKKYRYNYLGLYLAALRITHRRKNRYYCSEFVREMLHREAVSGVEELPAIIRPIHFCSLPDVRTVYCGKLRDR